MFTYHCFLALEGVSVLTTNTPIRTEANLANNDLNDKDSIPSIQSSTDKITQTSAKRRGRGPSISTILRNKENNSSSIGIFKLFFIV